MTDKIKIVVVDDADIRETLEDVLLEKGYPVGVVGDGQCGYRYGMGY